MTARERARVVRRAQEAGYFEDALWAWGHAPPWSAEERRASWAIRDAVVGLVGSVDGAEAAKLVVCAMAAHWNDSAGVATFWADRVRALLSARRPRPRKADRTSPGRAGSGDADLGR